MYANSSNEERYKLNEDNARFVNRIFNKSPKAAMTQLAERMSNHEFHGYIHVPGVSDNDGNITGGSFLKKLQYSLDDSHTIKQMSEKIDKLEKYICGIFDKVNTLAEPVDRMLANEESKVKNVLNLLDD